MKKLCCIFISVVIVSLASAQSVFQNVTFKNKPRPGLMLKLSNKPSIVEDAIFQKLKEINYSPEGQKFLFIKSKKENGFYIYRGVVLPDLHNQPVDLLFKVTERSKYEKDKSNLYMLVRKGYDNFVSPQNDTIMFTAARRFLNGFASETAAYKKNIEIEEQVKNLTDTQKKILELQNEEKDLQAKLQSNKSAQQSLQKEIDDKKEKLLMLRGELNKIEQ